MLSACQHSTNQKDAVRQSTKLNDMTYPVKHISISINKSADEVYRYASDPENFPEWVAFIKSVTKQNDLWIGKSDIGDLKIKWTPPNDFRIIDHQVTLTNGEIVNNPMRVVPNNEGCEFIFTLFWLPNRTEKEFNEDAKAVTADLQKLKEILESNNAGIDL